MSNLSRRDFVKLAGAASAGLGLTAGRPWSSPAHAAGGGRRPNLIFILADDAGIGDFGCYGSQAIHTPNIDRLAAEGMRFTHAYSGSAVCAPTRCVCMTGLHTGHGPVRANREIQPEGQMPLPTGTRTTAQVIQDAGYRTACIGKWGLGMFGTTGDPLKNGFNHFFGYNCQRHAHSYFPTYLYRDAERFPLDGKTYSPDLMVADALSWIKENRDHPFFLFYATTLPHGAFEIPSDAPYSNQPWPQQVRNYAAMVSRLDTDTGKLMQALKDLGLEEDTLLLFGSDNGATPQFVAPLHSSAGLRGTKRFLYEGGVRAPFVARWPGHIRAGTTSDFLTSHVDLMPTAAELAGAPAPRGVDGVSLLPTFLGREPKAKHEHLYWEIYEPYFQQAVRVGDWKGYRTGTAAPLELYDLKADPTEEHNLAADYPDVVKRIEALMAQEHGASPDWVAPALPRRPGAGRR